MFNRCWGEKTESCYELAEQPECTKELPCNPRSKKAPQGFLFSSLFFIPYPIFGVQKVLTLLLMLTHYFHCSGLNCILKSNPKCFCRAGICKCQPWLPTLQSMGATSSLASHLVPQGTFQSSIWCRWSSWAPKTTCPHSCQGLLLLEGRNSVHEIRDNAKVNNLCIWT